MSLPLGMFYKRITVQQQIYILHFSLRLVRTTKEISCGLQSCSPINIYIRSQFGQTALKPTTEIATRDNIELFLDLI